MLFASTSIPEALRKDREIPRPQPAVIRRAPDPDLLTLQRTAGNRAVCALLSELGISRKRKAVGSEHGLLQRVPVPIKDPDRTWGPGPWWRDDRGQAPPHPIMKAVESDGSGEPHTFTIGVKKYGHNRVGQYEGDHKWDRDNDVSVYFVPEIGPPLVEFLEFRPPKPENDWIYWHDVHRYHKYDEHLQRYRPHDLLNRFKEGDALFGLEKEGRAKVKWLMRKLWPGALLTAEDFHRDLGIDFRGGILPGVDDDPRGELEAYRRFLQERRFPLEEGEFLRTVEACTAFFDYKAATKTVHFEISGLNLRVKGSFTLAELQHIEKTMPKVKNVVFYDDGSALNVSTVSDVRALIEARTTKDTK